MDTTKSAADWADAHWSPLTGEGTELTSFNTWHHRRFGFVDHRNVTCASRWAIWQASREAVVVELPPAPARPEEPEFALDDSHMDAYNAAVRMRDACAKAIEAQGLKVKP
ncbi:hypothetical protein [Pseudomonas sp. 2835]|uniref:hypothetical protein n=1 Tax=Pseudomonas sp. 2835 TaxID=3156451 RepID=UPI003D1B6FB1